MLAYNGHEHEVIRIRTVKVLEVGKLDALPHAEQVCSRAEAVHHHPSVASIECRDLLAAASASQSVLNVCPRSNDRAEDHQAKGEQSHWCDVSAKPDDLTICNENNCQILEDGIDGNAEILQRLGRGIDHADKEEGDWKPLLGLFCVEVAELSISNKLQCLDSHDTDNTLLPVRH